MGARPRPREGALSRVAPRRPAAARGRVPGVRRVRAPAPARQQPSALLGLGDRQRHCDGGLCGDAGRRYGCHERHLLLRQQQLRGTAGPRLVQDAARLPVHGQRPAHQWMLGVEPDRPRGRAKHEGRVRSAEPWLAGSPAAADRLLFGRSSLLVHEGRRAARSGDRRPAPCARGRSHADGRRGAQRIRRARSRRRTPPHLRRRRGRDDQHGGRGRPPESWRLLRAGRAVVPRRRRLRRLGRHRPAVQAPRGGDGARRFTGLRPAQVDVPDLPRRLRPRQRRGRPSPRLLPDSFVPRPR